MNRVRDGFALPTVLIASIVMMMVLMAALTSSSGTRSNLDEQYYLKLAQEAAEAGAVYAQNCMQDNGFVAPWSGRTLVGGDDCDGNTDSGLSGEIHLISNDNLRTRWVVADVPASTDQQFIDVTGYTELLRQSSSTAVWKTYTKQLRVRVSSEVGVTKVAFGYGRGTVSDFGMYFGAITTTGEVRTIGLNESGQLGNGTTINATSPQKYLLPDGVAIRDLYASFLSTGQMLYAVTTDDQLYAVGLNDGGQLGLGHNINPVSTPTLVTSLPPGERVAFVDNNTRSTYVVTKSGAVYASGFCERGTLGTGGTWCPNSNVFKKVAMPAGTVVVELVTDATTVFVRTDDGRVFGWGNNTVGAFGDTPPPGLTATSFTLTPIQIAPGTYRDVSGDRATKIATDGRVLYVIREDGSLWGTGSNAWREIINTSVGSYTVPTRMNPPGCNGTAVDIRADNRHIAVLYADGHACTAGYNGTAPDYRGQVGHNTTNYYSPLTRVTGTTAYGLPSAVRIIAVSVNSLYGADSQRSNNTFLVGDDGKVYGAGSNFYGQLGTGDTVSSTKFVPMQVFGSSEPARFAQSGLGTTVIFTMSGRVYAVGNNEHGQIGDGTTNNTTMPMASNGLNIGPPTYF